MNPKFVVGDVVTVEIDYRIMAGEILKVENSDATGQVRYLVDIPEDDPTKKTQHIFPEDALSAVAPLEQSGLFSSQAVMAYLESGALIDMLKSYDGGKSPPRARLFENEGVLNYTLNDHAPCVLGATIPFDTVAPEKTTGTYKIFWPAKPRVVLYLRSFGLSRQHASRVVNYFPTYPS